MPPPSSSCLSQSFSSSILHACSPLLTQSSFVVLAVWQQLCITDTRTHAHVGKIAHNSQVSPQLRPTAGQMSNIIDDVWRIERKANTQQRPSVSSKMDLQLQFKHSGVDQRPHWHLLSAFALYGFYSISQLTLFLHHLTATLWGCGRKWGLSMLLKASPSAISSGKAAHD